MGETTTEAPEATGGDVINGVQVDDQGMAVPQPEATEQAEAVTETTEQPEPKAEEKTETKDEPSDEEQLAKFAESKGLTLDSDNAKKAAKMAMEAERNMHKATKKASELEKATNITENDISPEATPQEKDGWRVRNLELKMDIRQWKQDNPDKLQYEDAMVKVLSDPTKKQLVQAGYLNLDDVYSIAMAGNTDTVRSQGKREALESLAQKQQAAVPTGHAVNSSQTNSEQITPQNVDRLVASHDQAWFEKHYDKINRAMAGI